MCLPRCAATVLQSAARVSFGLIRDASSSWRVTLVAEQRKSSRHMS